MTTATDDPRVKKLEADLEAASQRETALNARTVELGTFQQQTANLADTVAELQAKVDALTAENEQLARDAKEARAAAKSATDSAGADVAKVEAAVQLAKAIKALS